MANTWKGTGLGVIQAVNTFAHHYGEIRGKVEGVSDDALRTQRNNERRVKGGFADIDNATIDALVRVWISPNWLPFNSVSLNRCASIGTYSFLSS